MNAGRERLQKVAAFPVHKPPIKLVLIMLSIIYQNKHFFDE